VVSAFGAKSERWKSCGTVGYGMPGEGRHSAIVGTSYGQEAGISTGGGHSRLTVLKLEIDGKENEAGHYYDGWTVWGCKG
jgi:hypothetical protein